MAYVLSRGFALPALFALQLLAGSTAAAEEPLVQGSESPAAAPGGPAHEPWTAWDRMTGDWGGFRTRLEDTGVTFDLGLTTTYQHGAHGGLRTFNAHRITGTYEMELTFDFEKMKLWRGGTLYVMAEGGWGDSITEFVGDLFDVNFDANGDRAIDVTELWYEQAFLDNRLRLRFGKMYLPNDFDVNAFANDETEQFFNTALVNTWTIPFPSYWAQGAQCIVQPTDWLYFAGLAADAEADFRETGLRTTFHGRDDFFSMFEAGLTPVFDTPAGKLAGNYRFGLWYDPPAKEKFFNDLGGRRRTIPLKRDDLGFYTSCDQVLFRENPADQEDEQGLGLFWRYGYAPPDVNEAEHFWSVGAQYAGLVPTRDEDVLAFGVAQGILSDDLKKLKMDPHRETVFELYYRMQVLGWLTVTPDFQWILRPGGEDGRDAFVAGLRLQFTF